MWRLSLLCFLLLCSTAALVAAQGSHRPSKWQTLKGNEPLVVARGGFSGIFPDSSLNAFFVAVQTGLPNLHVWCDVQLTKDGSGICFPDIKLENASNIADVYPKKQNTYIVNGASTKGWFSVDFTLKDLGLVNLKQRIFSRAPNFDGSANQILTVEDMVQHIQPPKLWLSVPYAAFFSQHNLSMRSYIISVSRNFIVNYVSSPEVGFLRSVASRLGPTKLIFQFLGQENMEPTLDQTYGSLLKNLTFIKTFATGILIPKYYILKVDNSLYIQDSTSVVSDAHAAGLEVFAYNFANDDSTISYNYSYDSVSEYLSFIDNGKFSVDGLLSDFPITASATVDCYAHMSQNDTANANLLVISNEGASGDYPGCTNTSYEKAVSDGVDILDCPVQITSDGIPFCLGSINLRDRTNVDRTDLSHRATDNPELGVKDGIFTYNLTWNEIKMNLRPAINNLYSNFSLFRNPKAGNDGELMQLTDFLAFANASSVSGVIISIENAAYLAEKQGLGVTDAVLDTLSNAGFNNAKKVMIKSSDSAVLSKFKSLSSKYELVYMVDENIRDILNSTILEIKKLASSVVVSKKSVLPTDSAFLTVVTNVVPKLQASNLSVYVQFFRNEFVSQPWDFFSDPYVEINTYYSYVGINGVITDYPATAARFKRNRCLGYKDVPIYMSPVQPGSLLSIMAKIDLPPAEAPSPILTDDNVLEPALPPVTARTPPTPNSSGVSAPSPTSPNGQPTLVAGTILSCMALLLAAFMLC